MNIKYFNHISKRNKMDFEWHQRTKEKISIIGGGRTIEVQVDWINGPRRNRRADLLVDNTRSISLPFPGYRETINEDISVQIHPTKEIRSRKVALVYRIPEGYEVYAKGKRRDNPGD